MSKAQIQESLSIILKIAADMVKCGISEDISDWHLPKTTPTKTKRKIIFEANKWNEINKQRAIKLKSAFDVLSKCNQQLIVAEVRDYLDLLDAGEITFSKFVELLNTRPNKKL